MSVLSFAEADLFTITIKKFLLTNPENSWVNRYEMRAVDAGFGGTLLAAGLVLLEFEKALHSAAVFFSQLSVATWAADSVPYDPDAFISSPISAVGDRVLAEDLLPLSTCLSVTRVCASGRFGHVFYRGALYESEQSSPAGKATLTGPLAMQTRIDDAITASGLDDYFSGGTAGLIMVMVNKTGAQVREVVGFVQGGISQVPSDHAWYNRTTPTP